jgi:hypothetical protein
MISLHDVLGSRAPSLERGGFALPSRRNPLHVLDELDRMSHRVVEDLLVEFAVLTAHHDCRSLAYLICRRRAHAREFVERRVGWLKLCCCVDAFIATSLSTLN